MNTATHTPPALKACPFCACAMRIESNRDWHRIFGSHTEDCLFEEDAEQLMVPASPEQLQLMIECWNARFGELADLMPSGAAEPGEIDQAEDGMWTAGIRVGAHGNKIEVHDTTRVNAEALRDAICTALGGKVPSEVDSQRVTLTGAGL